MTTWSTLHPVRKTSTKAPSDTTRTQVINPWPPRETGWSDSAKQTASCRQQEQMQAQQITACVRHIKPAVIREGRHASCEKQTTCLGSTQLCFHAGKKPTPNALKNPGIPANVKPCSISFEHFSLGHVLCATVTCPFRHLKLPNVVRERQFSTLFT